MKSEVKEEPSEEPSEEPVMGGDPDIPEVLPDRMRGDSFQYPSPEAPNPEENTDLIEETRLEDTLGQSTVDEIVVDTTQVDRIEEKPNHDPFGTEGLQKGPDVSFGDTTCAEPSEPPTPPSPEIPFATPSIAPTQVPEDAHVQTGADSGKGRGFKRPNQFEEYYAVASIPPPVLTEKAIDSRLRRIFKPRADGTLLVDESWRQQWADKEGRIKVLEMFEKVGYNTDWGENRAWDLVRKRNIFAIKWEINIISQGFSAFLCFSCVTFQKTIRPCRSLTCVLVHFPLNLC